MDNYKKLLKTKKELENLIENIKQDSLQLAKKYNCGSLSELDTLEIESLGKFIEDLSEKDKQVACSLNKFLSNLRDK